jgi:tetratricopeptide (TPR) repeat protein
MHNTPNVSVPILHSFKGGKQSMVIRSTHYSAISKNLLVFISSIVAILTVLVYLPALQNGFVNWDDGAYVYKNSNIMSIGLPSLKWSLTAFHSGNWHPLTWFSHALDYAIWGLNPAGHHFTSVILHGLNTFLVTVLVFNLISLYKYNNLSPDISQQHLPSYQTLLLASAVTGLLFGLHPLHVESVAWVSERKDVLCAFFFLLSILSYLRYAAASDNLAKRYYLLSVIFFALALTSKPMAITLPVVLFILDFHPLKRFSLKIASPSKRKIFLEKIPFLLMSVGSAALTLLAQKEAMSPLELYTPGIRALVAIRAVSFYLVKMIYPMDLVPLYPHPKEISLLSADYMFALLLDTGITFFCVWSWLRKEKFWLTIWLYYLITLLPVLGIIQVGAQAAADRYTYLPSIGPFLLAGLGVAQIMNVSVIKKQSANIRILSSVILSLVVVIPTSVLTMKQTEIWKDSMTLWNAELKLFPNSCRAYFTRGSYYYEKGMLKQSLDNFNRAIELEPRFVEAYYNRGIAYEDLGDDQQALRDYTLAISLRPEYQLPYNNRGRLYGKMGQYGKALKDFDMAVKLDIQDSVGYFNRGLAYKMMGEKEKSDNDFRTAARLGNKSALNYLNRN